MTSFFATRNSSTRISDKLVDAPQNFSSIEDTTDNKTELLENSQGKAKAEVQKLVVQYQEPVMPLKKEKVVAKKVIVENKDPLFSANAPSTEETRFTITVEVDAEFMELLKEAKDLVGFAPSAEVLKRTLKEYVVKRKQAPKQVRAVTPKVSRYIPKAVAHGVRNRDQHQCSFVSPNGKRCSETCGLEFDHIKPFALGGTNAAANLRLLCTINSALKRLLGGRRSKVTSTGGSDFFSRRESLCLDCSGFEPRSSCIHDTRNSAGGADENLLQRPYPNATKTKDRSATLQKHAHGRKPNPNSYPDKTERTFHLNLDQN